MNKKMIGAAMTALTLGLGAIAPAMAADYPSKPLRIVVGFPPGQATDIIARLVAKKLEEGLKQPVVVENKPGAGGIIGTEQVIRAEPDGYTLLVSSSGPLAINPSLYKNISYDPLRDLASISEIAVVPLFLAVTNNSKAKTAADLVKMAKAQPGKLNYASGGSGVTSHLTMELFKHAQQFDMQHVPYKGSPAAVTDLIGGQVEAMIDTGPALIGNAQSGKLRLLAVASEKRNAAVPDVPTMAEAGMGDFVAPAWISIMAPAKTPKPVIDKLYATLQKVWAEPDVTKTLNALGAEPILKTPDETRAYVQAEITKWAEAVKLSGARVD